MVDNSLPTLSPFCPLEVRAASRLAPRTDSPPQVVRGGEQSGRGGSRDVAQDAWP